MRIAAKCAVLFMVAVVMIAISPLPSTAQATPPQTKTQQATPSGYPVMLGNQTIFYVRDVKGYPGEERAKTVIERARRVAEDPGIPVTSVRTSPFQQPITLVTAGDELLMAVFDEDGIAEGRTRQEVATEYTQKLRTAIENYRQEHSARRILIASLYTLIATLLLIGVLYVITRLYRRSTAAIQAWHQSKKVSIHIQSFELVRAERIGTTLTAAMRVLRFFIVLLIIYTYINAGLSFFTHTKAFAARLFSYVLIPLKTIGEAAWAEIPKLVYLAIIVAITVYGLKVMSLFFEKVESGSVEFKGFYPEWAQPTYKICRLLVIAFAAVVAFPYIPGSNSPAFKGISVFLGVLFSLGSSAAVANILAGYTLIYRRVFKIGDRVKIGEFVGDVVATRLQVVHLRTIKNEEITVPSSTIVNSQVINYSALAKDKGLILHTSVTIGYDSPWRQIEALLLLAAERTPGVAPRAGTFCPADIAR